MKKNEHPIAFEHLKKLYLKHLSDDDNPTCYTAYCRAEADIVEEVGFRKLSSYGSFRTMLCRSRSRKKQTA